MAVVRLVVAVCWALIFASRSAAETFVYVSLSAANQIEIYRLADDGELVLNGIANTPGDPGGVAVHPSKKFLVAALRDAGKLASFAINSKNGSLQQINEVKVDVDPAYVEYDKTGRYLLTAYYITGKAAVHSLAEDGTISAEGKWYPTDKNAHAIVTDKTNRWAFVPHTGPNAIFQFAFDEKSGSLTANPSAAKVQFKTNTGPRHISLHTDNTFGYCDNEQGSSVTAMSFDPGTGTLQPIQTLSTIPSDFKNPNSCARMELHPTGKFLYAANRGHDSIAGFEIDPVTGKLKSIGIFPAEKTPRGFDIEPSGKFMIAAGEGANRLAVYSIPESGCLRQIGTYATGSKPWWVTTVKF